MLIGLVAEGEGGEEQESHSKVGTLLGPTKTQRTPRFFYSMVIIIKMSWWDLEQTF